MSVALDARRATLGGPAAIAARQRRRVDKLVSTARACSPYYRRIYRGLPAYVGDPHLLPPVTKPELMEHFDEWVTDPALTLPGVEGFVGDPSLAGAPYLGRYAVWTTSGTTGTPAIFVHDPVAVVVYEALLVVRGLIRWMNLGRSLSTLGKGGRVAYLFATGGHFAAAALLERVRGRYPWSSSRLRALSVLSPLAELVSELNSYQPAILAGYSTAMGLLAQERAEGRLEVSPVLAFAGAEWLTLKERANGLESALGRPLEVRASVGEAALILGVAREAEPALIAVGSRGLGARERLRRGYARLGSVSTKVLRAATGPVLVCPRE